MIDFLVLTTDKWAYLAGIAWILGFAALFIFFAVGGNSHTISDLTSVLQFLFVVPVALALHRILVLEAPAASTLAAAVGIAAMLVIALLQILLVLGVAGFEQTLNRSWCWVQSWGCGGQPLPSLR